MRLEQIRKTSYSKRKFDIYKIQTEIRSVSGAANIQPKAKLYQKIWNDITTWHRRGCNGTTPRCRSRNIAKNTFAGRLVAEILRICRFADRASHPPCKKHCKFSVFMRNAAKRRFWDHTMGAQGRSHIQNFIQDFKLYIK